jgi:hypothetical protein
MPSVDPFVKVGGSRVPRSIHRSVSSPLGG